ncbi:MAG: penicillin-binding transpeptidase domain-containing protein [Chloroflexi bacterium]|nr:penicillin-binding transpeptidase domain-containing protein [Chloroflexota bacterium]
MMAENSRIAGLFLFLLLVAASACESALLQEGVTAVAATPAQQLESTSGEPADVLAAFVEAWDEVDYEAMYRLIARRSRDLYPLQRFINQYTAAHSVIRFAGVEHSLRSVARQGATAVVHYDVVITSPTFGEIADNNRVMRLIEEGGWKIAWSSMDIFDGMSSHARLTERADFPARADIYGRNGKLLAEQGGTVYSLYAVKQDMPNLEDCLATLAEATLRQISSLRGIFAAYLGETRFHVAEMDPERYNRYREALDTDCAITRTEGAFSKVLTYDSRSYYGHGIATHVVGYIGAVPADELERWQARGRSAGDLVGRAGIEESYEDTLAGRPQRYLRIVEGGGTVIRELAGAARSLPSPVTLTIDRDLQEITAQTMADAVSFAVPNWGGITAGGAIAAMNVNSGEILALASYPSFDPHIFNPETDYNIGNAVLRLDRDIRNPFVNKALAEQYTPGSVYKIVTTLAAASENIWEPNEIFECGYIWRGAEYGDSERIRTDWRLLEDREPTGPVTMPQALAASCNPFFYLMGALMYREDPLMQARYAELLGFGAPSGLAGLGIEAAGSVAPPGEPAAAINNAIGQGEVTVTVVQMAQLAALIANGGQLYQPYIVSHIGRPGDADYAVVNEPTLKAQLPLDENALEVVRDGMCMATTVRDLGTAEFVFRSAPYQLCGKTGTAETLGNPHSWFIAYYPRENPEIAIAGVMAHSREGSEVVAPMIRRIIDVYRRHAVEPFPDWWQAPYIPVKSQQQALTEHLAREN